MNLLHTTRRWLYRRNQPADTVPALLTRGECHLSTDEDADLLRRYFDDPYVDVYGPSDPGWRDPG